MRMSFSPENVGNWSPSPQNDLEFSPRSVQSCFPLLQGPSCRKSPSALFRSNWETALDRSWRKLQVILRRGRPTSIIFGAKAHANVLKATFSTDCKSNCIRIGLREHSRAHQSTAGTNKKMLRIMLNFTLYLDEASDEKDTAARS